MDMLLTYVAGVGPSNSEGCVGQAISHSSMCTVSCVLNTSIVNVMWAAHPNGSPKHRCERRGLRSADPAAPRQQFPDVLVAQVQVALPVTYGVSSVSSMYVQVDVVCWVGATKVPLDIGEDLDRRVQSERGGV
jgi:hypothetical protein